VRRVLFQVHLWIGLLIGVYVLVVCVTGAALVFRIDMQRALHPHLFTPGIGAEAEPVTILEHVRDAYPGWRVSGIDAPTTLRPTYLAYVVRDARFLTLLIDPVSARVLGELPVASFARTLQDLHFDLLGGRTGRIVNGIGAMLLLVLCVTGPVIWWPGMATWRRGLTIDFQRPWKRVIWELHGATGIWTVCFIAMWAVTGAYFAFPRPFRSAVNALSPLTVVVAPQSHPSRANGVVPPSWGELIARARDRVPNQHVARVVTPFTDDAAFLVMLSPVKPTSAGRPQLTSVYLDQYTGEVLAVPPRTDRSAGDIVMDWAAPLHVGNFDGTAVRIAWVVLGLAPPLLFVTGVTMWWTRVVRPRWLLHRGRRKDTAVA
jgi:uncharacterized iron-regulated membrane protein